MSKQREIISVSPNFEMEGGFPDLAYKHKSDFCEPESD